MNLTRMSVERLNRLLAQYEKELAEKQAIAAAHQPGTAYHTRAQRESQAKQEVIAEIRQELSSR